MYYSFKYMKTFKSLYQSFSLNKFVCYLLAFYYFFLSKLFTFRKAEITNFTPNGER